MSESLLAGDAGESEVTSTPPADTTPVEGGDIPDFLKEVDESYRIDPVLKNIKDVPTLVKSFVEAQRTIGKKGVVLPTDKSSADEWKNLYKSLGLPESEDKYELKAELPEQTAKELKKLALEAGILPKQTQQMVDFFTSKQKGEQEAAAKEYEETVQNNIKALKDEWGEDGFNKNLNNARRAVREFGDENFIKYLDETGLGNDVNFIKFMTQVASNMTEDKFQTDMVSSFGKSKTEATQEINDIMSDKNHPYYNSDHQDHAKAVKQVQKLYEIAYS